MITSLFGLGALLALSPDSPPGLQSLLFGDVLGVERRRPVLAGVLAARRAGRHVAGHWRLLAAGFDRAGARASASPPLGAELALLVLLALAVLVGVQGLGNLLVVAVLVAPAATARTLTQRLGPMIALAAAIGVAGGVAGLYLSYYVDVAAGAAIAGLLVAAYLTARALSSRALRAGRAPSAPPAPARTAA